MSDTKKPATSAAASYDGFTAEERAAMRDHARELKAAASRKGGKADKAAADAAAVVEKIAGFGDEDRIIAEKLHAAITTEVPELAPKLWYGMPAYARDGRMVCFFQSAAKFRSRYATVGFSDGANLDDGDMWPVYFAVKELTPEVESRILALVKQAAS
ncbi:iron chaperone [Streptacidiphilus monticola]|uniref:Iron chaperone n=1 Tax=Streptacidiphilus monticola TaxID=2161674 RepID=A0ABW1G553_9ACTN